MFEPELNRTVNLTFEGDSSYMGIPTKRFHLDSLTYAAPKHNIENKCFCPFADPTGNYDGTLHVAHCNFEVPMVFSNPHFYQADSYFLTEITGFSPVKEEHESFADVTEKLGIVINGRKTVQLNIDTEAYRYYLGGSKRVGNFLGWKFELKKESKHKLTRFSLFCTSSSFPFSGSPTPAQQA